MANKEEKPEGKDAGWKDFIYNPRTGEFMGRTASSWALIFLFYVVFYGFLAGMFSLTMWVMLQTLSDETPRYRDRVSSPGMMIRPKCLDITVNRSDPTQYRDYVNGLETFLKQYNDTLQEQNVQCPSGEFYLQDKVKDKKVCQFKRTQLRHCSGLGDMDFGYKEGQPCVLIKMNRVIGLKPEGKPFVNCTAKRDIPLPMQYYPDNHFDKMYFPYYGKTLQPNYVQPLVAVKLMFSEQDYGTPLTIECRVEDSNLRNNDERDKFLGRVIFRVEVNK